MSIKMKKMSHRIISLFLTLLMVIGLMPTSILASGSELVYISISDEGQFITTASGDKAAYLAIPLSEVAKVDLSAYGLDGYYYDSNGDNKGDITALHLYIYVHEQIMGQDWNSVTVTGGPGSIYFAGGLFGFSDENLQYYYNGEYPQVDGWGVTADQIVLKNGDFFDIAHYLSWSFYSDPASGFHYFTDDNDEITHNYIAESGKSTAVRLVRATKDDMYQPVKLPEEGYTVYYGEAVGTPSGSVTTEADGVANITFPSAGLWYVWCNGGYGENDPLSMVSSPTSAQVIVTGSSIPETPEVPEEPISKDVASILNATMAQMANTVTAPAFGTNAGEWTVLSLARGGYYNLDNAYFTDYYDRIVDYVNTQAASINKNGALHKAKSTDNSRLIVALASIGKSATSVGDWNLIAPYSDFAWIKNQGINGVIWALIALDAGNYQVPDTTENIRQTCVDYLMNAQLADGGWALAGTTANSDITGMALQALYPYRNQAAVAAAAERALTCLSNIQTENGSYTSDGSETSESCSQVIVALTTWGINPLTDARFIKNGNTVIDAILEYYVEDEAAFKHVLGGTINGMATDQSCYALAAYQRYTTGKTALYNMSDVFKNNAPDGNDPTDEPEEDEPFVGEGKATLAVPEIVGLGMNFNAIVGVDSWIENTKMIDLVMHLPEGVTVEEVAVTDRLAGGQLEYNVDENNTLRIAYFNLQYTDLSIVGNTYPADLFEITMRLNAGELNSLMSITIDKMTLKQSSKSVVEMDLTDAVCKFLVTEGVTFNAGVLYYGNGLELIPADKKAIVVNAVGLDFWGAKIVYDDGENVVDFLYSAEISAKVNKDDPTCSSYVALVDYKMSIEALEDAANYTIVDEISPELTFGEMNTDEVVNAQDALMVVQAWLRKRAVSEKQILAANVTCDYQIDTLDALAVLEAYVNQTGFDIVSKAATALSAK